MAIASADSDDSTPPFNFKTWLKSEVPNYSNYDDLMNVALARIRDLKAGELKANAKAVVDFLVALAGNELTKVELERVILVLDLYWDVIERMDGLYAFPVQCSSALAVESEAHRVKNDLPALKQVEEHHWKLLRQYEMLGRDVHLERSTVAFDLAVIFAMEGSCDQAHFYLKDASSYSRQLRLQSRESKENVGEAMMTNLLRHLSAYFSFKELDDCPCRYLFKAGARDAYDLFKLSDMDASMPAFKDFKRSVKLQYLEAYQRSSDTTAM